MHGIEIRAGSFGALNDGSVEPHPLQPLSVAESVMARQAVISAWGRDVLIQFRSIALEEPAKKELVPFLEAEHAGTVTSVTPKPARRAMVQYDVVRNNSHEYTHSLVDIATGKEISRRVLDREQQAPLTMCVYPFFSFCVIIGSMPLVCSRKTEDRSILSDSTAAKSLLRNNFHITPILLKIVIPQELSKGR